VFSGSNGGKIVPKTISAEVLEMASNSGLQNSTSPLGEVITTPIGILFMAFDNTYALCSACFLLDISIETPPINGWLFAPENLNLCVTYVLSILLLSISCSSTITDPDFSTNLSSSKNLLTCVVGKTYLMFFFSKLKGPNALSI